MAAIIIKDLPLDRTLDRKARMSVRGGNASWVYNWISPYGISQRMGASVMNFYQTNNYYVADQMNNQIQVIDIDNAGAGATFNVSPKQVSINVKE